MIGHRIAALRSALRVDGSRRQRGPIQASSVQAGGRPTERTIPKHQNGSPVHEHVLDQSRRPRRAIISAGWTAVAEAKIRVAFVTNEAGLGDRSFNDMMNVGMKRAEAELGVEGGDRSAAGDLRVPVVLGAGGGAGLRHHHRFPRFDMIKPMQTIAKAFPEPEVRPRRRRPRSDRAQCREQRHQGLGRLVPGRRHRGQDDQDRHHRLRRRQGHPDHPPLLYRLLLRGQDGRPEGPMSSKTYSGTFTDPAAGKEYTLALVNQKSDINFAVAGATSAGVIDAAKSTKTFAIGVDSDQNYLAPGFVPDLHGQARRYPVLRHDQVGGRRLLQGRGPCCTTGSRRAVAGFAMDEYNKGMIPDDVLNYVDDPQGQGDLRARSWCPTTST